MGPSHFCLRIYTLAGCGENSLVAMRVICACERARADIVGVLMRVRSSCFAVFPFAGERFPHSCLCTFLNCQGELCTPL